MMNKHDYIIPELRAHAVSTDSLTLEPDNPNAHPERNMRAIMDSLDEFGQRQVIVAREDTRTVIAGNGRLEAARKLGWSHIACVFVDDDNMTAMRYAIADNRSAELSEWNGEVLAEMLQEIEDEVGEVEDIGFSYEELDGLIDALEEPGAGEWDDALGGLPDEDRDPITTWRFILHDDQKEAVESCLDAVRKDIDTDDPRNDNRNGNALYALCEWYMGQR